MAVRRTSINLDQDLVAEAKRALGLKQTTATIHEALATVVRRERVRRLLRVDFPAIELDDLLAERRSDPVDDLG